MPKIQQRYLDCSIYLYSSRKSAEDGENFGGSGCLVSIEPNPIFDPASFKGGMYTRVSMFLPRHIYAVTNKHVARRGFPVIRLNTIDNNIDVLELDHNDWIPHPEGDDLAIAPIQLPANKHRYEPIDISMFADRHTVTSDIGAGDDTFMVGRFVSHAGKQRNTPSLRFGSIAMLPFEKIKLGEAAGYHMQEAFLVETRSISGYSGSPVFVYKPEMKSPSEMNNDPLAFVHGEGFTMESIIRGLSESKAVTGLVGKLSFLGIDCGHVPRFDKVVDGSGTPHAHGWKVPANSGMAIVIPAWRLEDWLNTAELVQERKRKDKKYQKEKESEESTVMDVEKPETFTEETYQNALMRASRKTSEPESTDSEHGSDS